MTQQEFETRTGIAYSQGEFDDVVNPLYMAAGQLDKDKFCIEFKHHQTYLMNSRIVTALVSEVEMTRASEQNLKNQLKKTEDGYRKEIDNLAYDLVAIAAESGSKIAREKAIKLVGMKEYLRRKIELHIAFDKEDLEALRDTILVQE